MSERDLVGSTNAPGVAVTASEQPDASTWLSHEVMSYAPQNYTIIVNWLLTGVNNNCITDEQRHEYYLSISVNQPHCGNKQSYYSSTAPLIWEKS